MCRSRESSGTTRIAMLTKKVAHLNSHACIIEVPIRKAVLTKIVAHYLAQGWASWIDLNFGLWPLA